jgi:hypothetical protein
MIRHYTVGTGSLDALMNKIDTRFADQLQTRLGLLGYQAVSVGDRRIITVTLFENERQCLRAQAAAAAVRTGLAEFGVEQVDAYDGEVMVARGSEQLIYPIHLSRGR